MGAEEARSVAEVLVFRAEPSVSPSTSTAFGGTFVWVPKPPKAVAVTCSLCDMAQKGSEWGAFASALSVRAECPCPYSATSEKFNFGANYLSQIRSIEPRGPYAGKFNLTWDQTSMLGDPAGRIHTPVY